MSENALLGAFHSIKNSSLNFKKLSATNETAFTGISRKDGCFPFDHKTGLNFQKFPVANRTAFSRISQKDGCFPLGQLESTHAN